VPVTVPPAWVRTAMTDLVTPGRQALFRLMVPVHVPAVPPTVIVTGALAVEPPFPSDAVTMTVMVPPLV